MKANIFLTAIAALAFSSCVTKSEQIINPTGSGAIGKPVDLGLSVKWASWNIGASKPEEYGNYFAWGETKTKSDYSWSTYKWCKGSNNTLTKYCPANKTDWGGSGSPDGKTVLDLEDDVARVNWGGNWRIPTDAEWKELINNCTWSWMSNYNGTGKAGYIVTSKKSGYTNKYIFLPAAGFRYGTSLEDDGSLGGGYYSSSSLYTGSPRSAWNVGFSYDGVNRFFDYRCRGISVRPVTK